MVINPHNDKPTITSIFVSVMSFLKKANPKNPPWNIKQNTSLMI